MITLAIYWSIAPKFLLTSSHFEGILPKGPYMPCVGMTGRALLVGCHRFLVLPFKLYVAYSNQIHKHDLNSSYKPRINITTGALMYQCFTKSIHFYVPYCTAPLSTRWPSNFTNGSVRPSVRLSVRLSDCYTFLTILLLSRHHEIFRNYYNW